MDVLAKMEDNCIDTIITDPPYHLGSISKRFTRTSLGDDNDTAANARNGSNQYARLSTGFMGKSWDGGGIAFQPELWAEMLRVVRPGAMLLAFGGTRTHHRLMIAIEDAGWEIRDCLMWLYGSGFPKSANISKMLDKQAGKEREVVGIRHDAAKLNKPGNEQYHQGWQRPWQKSYEAWDRKAQVTAPATEAAKTFDGYGTGLKPAYEPIILAMKPIEQTYANNAQVWGVAGLNIDGARIGAETIETNNTAFLQYNGQNTRPWQEDHQPYNTQHQGRWPANVLLSHSEGCVYRGEKQVRGTKPSGEYGTYEQNGSNDVYGEGLHSATPNHPPYADPNGLETVSDWECTPDCAVRLLDEQSGITSSKPTKWKGFSGKGSHNGWKRESHTLEIETHYNDSGSASRFFYTAKAPNREKWFYCQLCKAAYPNKERDNHGHDIPQDQRKHIIAHPTVKPLEILKYLCTLTKTPTGGIVLDPFAGSGTTALACIETGRDFILIEKESDYYQIAKARVTTAMSEPRQAELF